MHQLEHKLHCNLLHFHWNQTLITISCTRGTLCLTAGHFLLLLNSPASVLIKTTCTWKRVVCEWFVMGLSLSPTRDVTLRFSKFASTSSFPTSFWATSQGQKLKRDISKSSEKIKFSNHEIPKNRKMTAHPALLSHKLIRWSLGGPVTRTSDTPCPMHVTNILKTFNVYSGRAMLGL